MIVPQELVSAGPSGLTIFHPSFFPCEPRALGFFGCLQGALFSPSAHTCDQSPNFFQKARNIGIVLQPRTLAPPSPHTSLVHKTCLSLYVFCRTCNPIICDADRGPQAQGLGRHKVLGAWLHVPSKGPFLAHGTVQVIDEVTRTVRAMYGHDLSMKTETLFRACRISGLRVVQYRLEYRKLARCLSSVQTLCFSVFGKGGVRGCCFLPKEVFEMLSCQDSWGRV